MKKARTKQNKTKQNKTKQNKTKPNQTKQNKTKQSKRLTTIMYAGGCFGRTSANGLETGAGVTGTAIPEAVAEGTFDDAVEVEGDGRVTAAPLGARGAWAECGIGR